MDQPYYMLPALQLGLVPGAGAQGKMDIPPSQVNCLELSLRLQQAVFRGCAWKVWQIHLATWENCPRDTSNTRQ